MQIMQLMNRNKNRWMYIHVCLPSHDPLEDHGKVLWEGNLYAVPAKYKEKKILHLTASLSDYQSGINGHYLIIDDSAKG